jgi:hypothetical protein
MAAVADLDVCRRRGIRQNGQAFSEHHDFSGSSVGRREIPKFLRTFSEKRCFGENEPQKNENIHDFIKIFIFLIDFCLSAEYNIILWKTVRYARYCIFRNTERHGIL